MRNPDAELPVKVDPPAVKIVAEVVCGMKAGSVDS